MIVGMVACTDSPSGTESSKSTATADTDEANTQPTEVVTPEEMKSDAFEHPSLVGGMKALSEAVSYPETAAEQGVQGRVFVQFTVMKDASLRDVQVVRGVSPELDAEAIRAVKETSFEPGTMDGEPVPVRMTLPITFQLSNEG
jgi:TonB family protein